MTHSLAGSTSLALSIASTDQPLRLRLPTASAGKGAALTGHGDDGSASLTVIASRCARSDQRSGRPPVARAHATIDAATSLTTSFEPAM